MDKFLGDFISTRSSLGNIRAAYLLEAAKVDKITLSGIAEKLGNTPLLGAAVLGKMDTGSLISGSAILAMMNEAYSRFEEMFRVSNDVSLVLNSNNAILSAEVRALEEELNNLQKMVDNYSFLLADGAAYDFSYIETFSDEKGKENFADLMVDDATDLPDRAGLIFAENDAAEVVKDEGILSIRRTLGNDFPLTGRVLGSNCTAMLSTSTPVNNSTSGNSSDGWRVVVKAPAIVNTGLEAFTWLYNRDDNFPGAQFILEYTMPNANPVDTFRIDPFAEVPFELIQIVAYETDEEKNGAHLLSEPIKLEGVVNVYFPRATYKRFVVYLRQTLYQREANNPLPSEEESKKEGQSPLTGTPFENAKDMVDLPSKTDNTLVANTSVTGHWQKIFESFKDSITTQEAEIFRLGIPRNWDEHLKWGWAESQLAKLNAITNAPKDFAWLNDSPESGYIQSIVRRFFGGDNGGFSAYFRTAEFEFYNTRTASSFEGNQINFVPEVRVAPYPRLGDSTDINYDPDNTPNPAGGGNRYYLASNKNEKATDVQQAQFAYMYIMGIRHVSVSLSAPGFKGVYISKQIEAPGDIAEVKIKESSYNYVIGGTNRDSTLLTSIEYSVTNRAKISSENDWVPILPVGTVQVKAERLYPDERGQCFFRFNSKDEEITIYKNGFKFEPITMSAMIIRRAGSNTVYGVNLPLGSYVAGDILTIDYVPASDYTIVNFGETQIGELPLAPSSDEDGPGEGFPATGQTSYTLNHAPFVNNSRVVTSTYNTAFGLTPYQPIVVKFSDGSTAVNLTNYKGGTQTALNPESSSYQFVHSGNDLLFNKPINQDFRVYYDYFPSNVRVRVVLRSNYQDNVSPKVDFFQLKAKSRKADPTKD